MATELYQPQIAVNGVVAWIKPNSVSYKGGAGDRKSRVASGGAGKKESINTEDIETQRGYIKFVMHTTTETVELVEKWQRNFDANTVAFQESGITRTMTSAIMLNDPEIAIGVEGEAEIVFEGEAFV